MAAGRPQGTWKGGTEAANELARFLREVTESLTVREMAERYGGGKTAWGQYRSGERIIPLGRLNTVIRDRVRDGRGREAMLKRARRLHDTALTADMRKAPAPRVDEALRRAEADLAESGRLVQSLLAVITMLQETISPLQAAPTGRRWDGRAHRNPSRRPGTWTRHSNNSGLPWPCGPRPAWSTPTRRSSP